MKTTNLEKLQLQQKLLEDTYMKMMQVVSSALEENRKILADIKEDLPVIQIEKTEPTKDNFPYKVGDQVLVQGIGMTILNINNENVGCIGLIKDSPDVMNYLIPKSVLIAIFDAQHREDVE